MEIKTVTWNIGGGKLLEKGADPTLLASYTEDGLDSIVELLEAEQPDIVTLQEVQQKKGYDQVEIIAKKLGYAHYFHDITSDSHIDTDCTLGHAVISKHPISQHRSGFFYNPKAEIVWEDGSVATSFDKGFSNCLITIDGIEIEVTTLHLIPFRRFNIELSSQKAKTILENVTNILSFSNKNVLVQGDFNIDSDRLEPYFRDLFDKENLSEVVIDKPTNPKGRKYDHVLYRGLKLESMKIISGVRTDHYPVICTFRS